MHTYLNFAVTRIPATRIELLLALYDTAVERVAVAITALRDGDLFEARHRLTQAQLIVTELSAGVRVDIDSETSTTILRLYEYVAYQLALAKVDSCSAALKILFTLREGFQAVRDDAIGLERSGQIPTVAATHALSAIA